MDDLISRAAAIEYLMTNMVWRDEDGYEVDDADEKRAIITDLVNGIPAVDAAPVVHGHWDVSTEHFAPDLICSVCDVRLPLIAGCCMDAKMKFCPNCGAKMDGERRDEDAAD